MALGQPPNLASIHKKLIEGLLRPHWPAKAGRYGGPPSQARLCMTEGTRLVCGKCLAHPEIVTSPNAEPQVRCPICGQRDSLQEAVRIAAEHASDDGIGHIRDEISATRASHQFLRFDPQSLPRHRVFRWRAI